MKRPMITFDELMSMSDEERAKFSERDAQLLAKGLIKIMQVICFGSVSYENAINEYQHL